MTKKEFFDHVSQSEDPLLFAESDRPKIENLKCRLGDITRLRVVEPGCGVGPLTECLSGWVGEKGKIVAFDVSEGMIERARARLASAKNVEVFCASAESVKLQPASWDLIILFRVFPHFDNKTAVLQWLRPAIAPGGRLVIANLEGSTQLNALHAGFSEPVRHDHMPCLQGTRALLNECGYGVRFMLDTPDEFYAEAVPTIGGGI